MVSGCSHFLGGYTLPTFSLGLYETIQELSWSNARNAKCILAYISLWASRYSFGDHEVALFNLCIASVIIFLNVFCDY